MHFEKPGERNTSRTLSAAVHRAGELGIRELVVATTTGSTALSAGRFPETSLLEAIERCRPNLFTATLDERA